MKRVIGYTLFWLAIGMMIMMFLPNTFVGILVIAVCMLVSYYLFSCGK